ncbi:hypothetical protein [Ramlibacter sp.]|uniref:hypothetical protein n=1 Tax=Ramlibacter sp. TaxID=1917967 RepID=UPI002D7F3B1B|nr:hypothetical protein [Ramlibacter sp.]
MPLSQPAAPAAPSSEVLAEARRAVRGFTVCMTANLTRHDRLGQYLFGVSAVVPMMDTVLEAPHRTCHENASVAELRPVLSDGGSPPNTLAHLRSGLYGMHACPGDQTLVVASDGPWFLYCAREPREGERAADVKRYVQIRVPAGQAVVTIPKDRPYGLGTAPGARTIVHGVRRSGTEVAELGSDGIEVIGGRAFTTEELDPPQ